MEVRLRYTAVFTLRLVFEGAPFCFSKHGVASDHISASIMALQDVQTGPSDDMYNFCVC